MASSTDYSNADQQLAASHNALVCPDDYINDEIRRVVLWLSGLPHLRLRVLSAAVCDLRAAEDAEPLAGVARSVARELTANGSERVGRRDCNDRYWSSNSISNSRDRDRK